MKHPLVSIILVNWNGRRYLGPCLRSLTAVTYARKEIILVDNASTDGSVVWVQAHYPDVSIVKNKENLGFAGGHEAGVRVARGDFFLLLNVDTVAESSFLTPLVERLNGDSTVGVVQPKVVLASQRRLIDSIGAFFLPNGILYHYGREKDEGTPQYNVPLDIFSAKGVCMLIRRETIDRVGLFDPEYFAYFEETDFCMRVWLAGWRVCYEPRSRIYHAGGAASSQQPASRIVYHSSKNVLVTYLKNLSFRYALRVIPMILILYSLWSVINIVTGKFSAAYAVLAAIGWNVTHLSETRRKRRKVQRAIRTRPDEAFLPALIHPVRLRYYYEQFFGNLGRYRDIPILPQPQ